MSAPIDAILGILVQNGATELRLGSARAPKMFQHGAQKRLALPETSDAELRHLLGGVLSEERAAELRAGRRLDLVYDAAGLGAFQVSLAPRADGSGFDVVFVRTSARRRDVAPPGSPPNEAAETPRDGARASRPPAAPIGAASGSTAFAAGTPAGAPPEAASAPVLPAVIDAPFAAMSGSTEKPTISADLAALLTRAVEARASDVHARTGEVPCLRVDGRLRALGDEPVTDVDDLLRGALGESARAALAQGKSADLAFDLPALGRFRANVFRSADGLAMAVRLLPGAAPALAALQLPMSLEDLVDLPHGLVIVCGPTGSGKSTTLAALAQEALRRRSVALVSLEDPIEYVFASPSSSSIVRQRQIGRDVRDFATGLRDALREDPDVLVVGEMRDAESISLALTAAETGHLVLTSLHSRSTASAVERIVDTYAPERQTQVRVQLADALRAVVAQRLLPRARGGGRVAAVEVLRVNHAVAMSIREGRTAQIPSAIQAGRKDGMLPLERCLADLVRAGQVTIEAARAVANEPGSLETYARTTGP